jgi:hypothetical protein
MGSLKEDGKGLTHGFCAGPTEKASHAVYAQALGQLTIPAPTISQSSQRHWLAPPLFAIAHWECADLGPPLSALGANGAHGCGARQVRKDARKPLKDAAAMNATRDALCEALRALDVPITTWSGGCTRWNRDRFGVEKAHCLDALCVGELAGAKSGRHRTLAITAMGRGRYSRTNVNDSGFPTGYLMRTKQIMGVKTGDRVRAVVPAGFAAHGTHTGRIAVRANRQFRLGKVQGIPARFCRVLQLVDGFDYAIVETALHV